MKQPCTNRFWDLLIKTNHSIIETYDVVSCEGTSGELHIMLRAQS